MNVSSALPQALTHDCRLVSGWQCGGVMNIVGEGNSSHRHATHSIHRLVKNQSSNSIANASQTAQNPQSTVPSPIPDPSHPTQHTLNAAQPAFAAASGGQRRNSRTGAPDGRGGSRPHPGEPDCQLARIAADRAPPSVLARRAGACERLGFRRSSGARRPRQPHGACQPRERKEAWGIDSARR